MKKLIYTVATLWFVLVCSACSNDNDPEYPGHEELARQVISYCKKNAYSVLGTDYEKDLSISYECTLNVSGKKEAETALRKLVQQINRIAGCDFIDRNTDAPGEGICYYWRKDFQSPIILIACMGNSELKVTLTCINGYMINSFVPGKLSELRHSQ
ncbi:MAG: hypothetical protein LUF04_03935 [Bacteroides sp.]|nr:hypothetical protein [Bacteroides sp.]